LRNNIVKLLESKTEAPAGPVAGNKRGIAGKTGSMPVFLFLFYPLIFILIFVLVLILVVFEVVFVLVFFVLKLKLDRIDAGDSQRRPALVAREQIAFVQIFFFYVNERVTFRATDHRIFISGNVTT
jgi:hypothetical protein